MSFASLAYSACRAYPDDHDWMSWFSQEHLGLTGCLEDVVCSASGSSTPGLSMSLAKMRRRVLPSGMHRPWAVSNRNHVFGAQSRSGPGSQPIPFTLTTFRVYASTLNFDLRLISTQQNSILGPWLAVTQAGFTPARLQTISSPQRAFGGYPPSRGPMSILSLRPPEIANPEFS